MDILIAIVVFVFTMFVNVLGAWIWSRAIADAHRARSHAISVREQEELIREAHEAVEEARDLKEKYTPPTVSDRDIRDAIIAERAEREYSTQDNEEREGYGSETAPENEGMYVTVESDG